MFYEFNQNNSGGFFLEPAKDVFVEADSPAEANEIFESIEGCYFDPEFNRDCECCGHRWYPKQDPESTDYTLEEIMERIKETKNALSWTFDDESIPTAIIRFKNGSLEVYR